MTKILEPCQNCKGTGRLYRGTVICPNCQGRGGFAPEGNLTFDFRIHGGEDGDFGRIEDPEETAAFVSSLPHTELYGLAPKLEDASQDLEVFLWECELQVTGKDQPRPPHNQTIGDCTSHGTTGALEDLQYVLIVMKGDPYEFQSLSSEALYGAGRVDIGRSRLGGDGAVTAWLVKAALTEGVVPRAKYGKYDLSVYDGKVARSFGRNGVPAEIKDAMLKHLVKSAIPVTSASQACDLMATGSPIVAGTNTGFQMTRDDEGFCKRGPHWSHCTYFRGFSRLDGKRQGAVYQQSWGPGAPGGNRQIVTPGGKKLLLPEGAFFVEMDVFDSMMKQGDAFGFIDFHGIEALDWAIY